SAARYAELAEQAIGDARGRGARVLIVGGTGLYLRALRFGFFDSPPRDEPLRRRLYDEESIQPGVLHQRLQTVDPDSAKRIGQRDLVRIVRALEVLEHTGKPFS